MAREADVIALRDAVLARHGRIDVLVNNAGINPVWRGIEKISLADWQAIIDTNLTGTFLCCKYIGGAMGMGGSIDQRQLDRRPRRADRARCRTVPRRAGWNC